MHHFIECTYSMEWDIILISYSIQNGQYQVFVIILKPFTLKSMYTLQTWTLLPPPQKKNIKKIKRNVLHAQNLVIFLHSIVNMIFLTHVIFIIIPLKYRLFIEISGKTRHVHLNISWVKVKVSKYYMDTFSSLLVYRSTHPLNLWSSYEYLIYYQRKYNLPHYIII